MRMRIEAHLGPLFFPIPMSVLTALARQGHFATSSRLGCVAHARAPLRRQRWQRSSWRTPEASLRRPLRSAFTRRDAAHGFDHTFESLGDLHRGFHAARALRNPPDHVHVVALSDLHAMTQLLGGAVGACTTENAGGVGQVTTASSSERLPRRTGGRAIKSALLPSSSLFVISRLSAALPSDSVRRKILPRPPLCYARDTPSAAQTRRA